MVPVTRRMAYRYVNSRGVPYSLVGIGIGQENPAVHAYFFVREPRPHDEPVEDLPPDHAIIERRGLAREPLLVPTADAERITRENAEQPAWAAPAVELVRCAFGGVPPREAYWPLVFLLGENASFRGLAELLCLLFDVEWATAYNDALAKDGGGPATAEEIERVRALLLKCGYDRWLQDE